MRCSKHACALACCSVLSNHAARLSVLSFQMPSHVTTPASAFPQAEYDARLARLAAHTQRRGAALQSLAGQSSYHLLLKIMADNERAALARLEESVVPVMALLTDCSAVSQVGLNSLLLSF